MNLNTSKKLSNEALHPFLRVGAVTCRFLSRLWKCSIWGMHEWTCNAQEGIPPTKEELESGINGFNSYSKMYCKRCNKISKLSL